MEEIGRVFLLLGIIFLFFGTVFSLAGKIPFIGRLPGDIIIKREDFQFYAPIGTCILLSLFFSLIFAIIKWLSK